MCGRFSITAPPEAIQQSFGVPERPNWPARYNVAPGQQVPVVRRDGDGARHLGALRWGLVPFWAADPAIGNRLINARSETAATKPAFRAAFARRRCLIVADGFYEWQATGQRGRAKQPYRVARPDGAPFAFAGLWESWQDPQTQKPLETCTILTTDANAKLAAIHARMPVILFDDAAFDAWLAPEATAPELARLLVAAPAGTLVATPVSTRVNKVANDDVSVLTPCSAEQATLWPAP